MGTSFPYECLAIEVLEQEIEREFFLHEDVALSPGGCEFRVHSVAAGLSAPGVSGCAADTAAS